MTFGVPLSRRLKGGRYQSPRPRTPEELLAQVVPNAASQVPVSVFAGELRGIRGRSRVRRPVDIPFERDGRYRDRWTGRESILDGVIGGLAFRQNRGASDSCG